MNVTVRRKIIIAWTHAQARHYAESMEWKRSEWQFTSDYGKLKGISPTDSIIYHVRTPGYIPSLKEQRDRANIEIELNILRHKGVQINVATLP